MPIVNPYDLVKNISRDEGGFERFPIMNDGVRESIIQGSDGMAVLDEFFASMETYERWFLWGFSVWGGDSEGNNDLVKE